MANDVMAMFATLMSWPHLESPNEYIGLKLAWPAWRKCTGG